MRRDSFGKVKLWEIGNLRLVHRWGAGNEWNLTVRLGKRERVFFWNKRGFYSVSRPYKPVTIWRP